MSYPEFNFIEVDSGSLVDSALKLRVHSGGTSGLEPHQGYVCIGYDPWISLERLSEDYDGILRIPMHWKVLGPVVRYKIDAPEYDLKLMLKILRDRKLPHGLSAQPQRTILACLKVAARISRVRTDDFLSSQFPNVHRFEVCIKADVATRVFGLPASHRREIEPGWVLLAIHDAARP